MRFRSSWTGYGSPGSEQPPHAPKCRQCIGIRHYHLGPVEPVHRGSDEIQAAGSTAAGDGALADDSVVVGQLFAAANRARRPNPDRLVDYLEPAVRGARVVDEARDVAADRCVAAPYAVDPKYPHTAFAQVAFFARVAVFVVSNQLAGIVDDAAVLRYRFRREDPVTMHRRLAPHDPRQNLLTHDSA